MLVVTIEQIKVISDILIIFFRCITLLETRYSSVRALMHLKFQ